MPESPLVQRESTALSTLEQLAAERARVESGTERAYFLKKGAAERGYEASIQKVTATWQSETETTQARYKSVRDDIVNRSQAEKAAAEKEYAEVTRKIGARAKTVRKAAKKEHEESRWQVLAVYESGKDSTVKRFKKTEAEIASSAELLETIRQDAASLLSACRKYAGNLADAELVVDVPPSDDPLTEFHESIKTVDERLAALARLSMPRFLAYQQFVWPWIILALAGAYPLGITLGWTFGLILDVVIAVGLALVVRQWLTGVARRQVAWLLPPYREAIAHSEALQRQCVDWSKADFERRKDEVEQRRDSDLVKADEKLARVSAESEQRQETDTRAAEEKYPPLLIDIQQRREEALKQADDRYPRRIAEIQERFDTESKQLKDAHREQRAADDREHAETWRSIVERWRGGLDEFRATIDQIRQECAHLFLDWNDPPDFDTWETPTAVPPALRFGEFEVDLAQIPNGLPRDERLKTDGPTTFSLPSLLPFPQQGSMLIKAADAGKVEAVQVLQAMMLRFLTSIPAGKVRFTIVDPVGLGENFAAFMHLADYSEMLVNSRIWTETSHIEQRLTDLSAHMENVIQKYLRNEFQTIEEYNIHAGEVAEPFRVLVVANFPTNFSEAAARRLVSIASSGARCGVYVLVSVDTKQPLPAGLQLKDLEPFCLNLTWSGKDGKFQWKDKEFSRFPLRLDAPPSQETFSRLLHIVGDRAKNANKVEVPFDFIAPQPEDYWTCDSSKGIDVPLGRAGATKLQSLKLGKGTSQHVLIAGKTGSGKSTLLHALITNVALRYSPDEVELYLIDFKKGVEFKVYAALELPHARVIAVESEREFGLSVLQRLDVELKIRGDKFRDLGVQDLNGYRQLEGQPPLPRILFIVDEFQEFFVEDDKISQDVNLLLDRMVRQGRAFGIHVHLGSQTLSGAYSLARSTLGQMAVRIALQCSEADAHMILSEDNSAARLLTRPGEAIYNDQNGLVEGNNFFQVVFLTDQRREEYLQIIHELAIARNRPPSEQIVFEGNLPAVASKNYLLNRLLAMPAWPEPPKADYSWLGDAIAIKDPTAGVFRPQSGSNLLIVGQNDEAATGIMAMSLISLGAQHTPPDPINPTSGARFYILDGSPADSSNAGQLMKVAEVLPHPVKEITQREITEVITEIAAEVERRQKEPGEAPAIYFYIYDLQRFRDLRKSDDDFGFGRYSEDKAVPPSKLFGNILREGPPVGVHTIVWCDSLNNLNRTFDRQGLKEFEIRVLFQMSANDSSTLLDSPAASKLGASRSLFFSEEEGRTEKFRAYGYPSDEWLDWVRQQFHNRLAPVGPNAHDGNGVTQPSTEASTPSS